MKNNIHFSVITQHFASLFWKFISIIFLMQFVSTVSVAQLAIIPEYPNESNIVYTNVPFKFYLSKKCDGKLLQIESENGKIERLNDSCSFLITPIRTGSMNITVLKNKKVMAQSTYSVKKRPEVFAISFPTKELEKRSYEIDYRPGIVVTDSVNDSRIKYKTISYRITLKDKDGIICSCENAGNAYDAAAKRCLMKFKKDDSLIISDIRYKINDSKQIFAAPNLNIQQNGNE